MEVRIPEPIRQSKNILIISVSYDFAVAGLLHQPWNALRRVSAANHLCGFLLSVLDRHEHATRKAEDGCLQKVFAAIASELAAEIYGLEVLKRNVEDEAHNTTRFYVMSRDRADAPVDAPNVVTTFVFQVRSIPAALYKALGGFATNGINMTKLESYMVGGRFAATQFLCDVDGHPEQPGLRRAFEELAFFSSSMKILGAYRAHPYRLEQSAPAE